MKELKTNYGVPGAAALVGPTVFIIKACIAIEPVLGSIEGLYVPDGRTAGGKLEVNISTGTRCLTVAMCVWGLDDNKQRFRLPETQITDVKTELLCSRDSFSLWNSHVENKIFFLLLYMKPVVVTAF